ncbi:MAG: hypothetical protein SNG49_03030 [Rikenellaceae bacterium]
MKKFISKIHRSANKFTLLDFALFKIYLFSVGILFGAYFASFWLSNLSVVWIVAVVTCVYTLVRLWRGYFRE